MTEKAVPRDACISKVNGGKRVAVVDWHFVEADVMPVALDNLGSDWLPDEFGWTREWNGMEQRGCS